MCNCNTTIPIATGPAGPAGADGIDGIDGQGIDHVSFTSTTGTGQGEPGETDTYTAWGDAGETINLGTFDITNGANGADGTDILSGYHEEALDITYVVGSTLPGGITPAIVTGTYRYYEIGKRLFLDYDIKVELSGPIFGASISPTDGIEFTPPDDSVLINTLAAAASNKNPGLYQCILNPGKTLLSEKIGRGFYNGSIFRFNFLDSFTDTVTDLNIEGQLEIELQ